MMLFAMLLAVASTQESQRMSLEPQGVAAAALVTGSGEITGCDNFQLGEPNDTIDMCELLETPDFLDRVLDDEIAAFEGVEVRLFVRPADNPDPKPSHSGTNARYHEIIVASFDVDASGFAKNCKIDSNSLTEEFLPLCDVFNPDTPDFVAGSNRGASVPMQWKLDLFATPRS